MTETAEAAIPVTEAATEETQEIASGSILGGNASTEETQGEETEVKQEPIDYGEFSLPEGVEVDKDLLDSFLPIFQEAGLSKEHAQQLVDRYAESLPKLAEEASKQARDSFHNELITRSKDWEKAVKTNPEVGGVKLPETMKNINDLYDAHISKEEKADLIAALDELGMGNHPVLVKLLSNAGKPYSEGKLMRAGVAAPKRDAASILFGESTTN